MKEIEISRRLNVSPRSIAGLRTKFLPLDYLNPRVYSNASRYKNLRRILNEEDKKIYHETWVQKTIDESNEDLYIVTDISNANRLDILAQNYYSDAKFWWVIAIANNIIDPFDVPVGTRLRIPPVISLYNQGGILSGN